MARRSSKRSDPESTDPFAAVDAKSVTDIEHDQRVRLQREPLPAAAKLTDLPLRWVVLTLLLCIAVAELGQRVEQRHLVESAERTGLIEREEVEQLDRARELARQREEIQRRIKEVRERRHSLERLVEGVVDGVEEEAEEEPSIPLSLESLRHEIRRLAGDSFGSYQRFGTLIALAVGAFGLILMALFVRLLAALVLGGLAFAGAFFVRLDGWILWTVALAGAGVGFALAPRLLLANMLINVALAGMVLGGVALGGGVYLATLNELYAIFGLGVGIVLGALLGFKYSRQLFLCAVLVNAAGAATLVLWLLWGELFPHFWPITFGGLMIIDAVATRIYHKVRWERAV